ncbi:MAG TPA: Ig-like domain-containing protein [Candidatus Limnocylindria bacterium]|nr:Ig-like domain-containing protein [Candidatus Limnocylindria bacterium]
MKKLKELAKSKRLGSAFGLAQRRKLGLVFVAAFAVIGSYMLFQSQAATGNDLIVTNVTMNPASPGAGQAVTFAATVRNQGTTPVPAGTAVGVGFQVDGQTVTWNRSNTSGLAAGASVTLTANAGTSGTTWAATTGPHTVAATADDTNVIPDEADEANNLRNLTFTIGSTGNLYLSPATTSVLVNGQFTVALRLTPGTTVDGVEATLTYDVARLQFVSMNATGSPFDVELGAQAGGSGTVTISRGNLSNGVSSDALVANVTFRALAGSGSATIQTAGNVTKGGAYTNPATANTTVTFSAPDTVVPSVSITSPANNTSASANLTVTANAADAVGVTRVELYVDGQLKGTDTSSPYSFIIDTKTLTSAAHTFQARAYDAAGNVGTSATVNVTVKNWAEDINQDGKVDLLDFSLLATRYGQTGTTLGRSDINGDGKVDLRDFSLLASKYGK